MSEQTGNFYEASFSVQHPSGVVVTYTVHTDNAQKTHEQQEILLKNRLDGGYTVAPIASSGTSGNSANDNPPQSQICEGFIIVTDVVNGKKSQFVKLPFKLANGEMAKFPKQVMGSAVELFAKSLATAGIEAVTGEYYEIPVKVTWQQGKEMPKKNPDDPVKHYTNWLDFAFLAKPAVTKPPIQQPEKDEIPF